MSESAWLPWIDGLLEAVWIVEPVGLHIIAVNRVACEMLRLNREEIVGRPVVDLAVTPEDAFFWEDVAAGLSDAIHSETMLRRADGELVEAERQVSRISFGVESYFVVGIYDKTRQRRTEEELERLVAELQATLESTTDGIIVLSRQGAIRGYNRRFAELWDLPEEILLRRDDAAVAACQARAVVDLEGYLERLAVINRTPLMEATDVVMLRSGVVLERVATPQYARGRPTGRVFAFRDVTQRLANEAQLQLAAKVFEASMDAIFVTNRAHQLIGANPRCTVLTGFAREELLAMNTRELVFDSEDTDLLERIESHLLAESFWESELSYRRSDGETAPGLLSMVRVPDENGRSVNFIGFVRDVSERVAAAKRIEELAYNDALTGLPNRVMLAEHIQFAISLAQRDGRSFAVLFIDLDRFKQINDALGHMFGDRVLIEVAKRIKSCLRQADTVARLGGDEYVLLLHDADAHGAEITAQRILSTLELPLALDDMSFAVSCSIGIALYPDDGLTMDDLIKNADTAMYRAKERGRAAFRFYRRQMNVDLLARVKVDHAMRRALENGDFRLHYQPQVDMVSGEIIGAEALLRWTDAELGEVSPARIIPVAEETGFITQIGDWVVREAVRQASEWRRRGLDIVVAINVSAMQFHSPSFVDSVAAVTEAAGLPAHRLEVELTESILVRDAKEALSRMESLAALGVKMSIDDFGTGYSSLTYLKRFPIQKLKIDRSFVSHLPQDESDAAIVCAVINLARALRLQVIAEGVETAEQCLFLREAGCDEYQGFLSSPALPAEQFEALYRVRQSASQRVTDPPA